MSETTDAQSTEYARQLQEALDHVGAEGFGDDVDSDSIVEEAAGRYLEQINSFGGSTTAEQSTDYGRSWRAVYWVEVEVTAETQEEATTKAREVVTSGNFDNDQLVLDDIFEVDPLTGCPPEPAHNDRSEAGE